MLLPAVAAVVGEPAGSALVAPCSLKLVQAVARAAVCSLRARQLYVC